VPPLADILSGTVHIDRDTGRCVWRDWTVGDCSGAVTIPDYYRNDLGVVVTRTIEVFFNIVDQTPRVHAPTSGDVRRRSLAADRVSPLTSPFHPWQVRITDRDGHNMGQREIMVDADTRAELGLSGIRYDLSIVYDGIVDARDELPEWFAENNWHHFIYAAISSDAVPGGNADGDGNCATPVNTCLTLNVSGKTARSDVRALLVSSGHQLAGQDRSIGDCDGDGIADDFLCAYFEGENSDWPTMAAANTFARDPLSTTFNDQVRIVEPLPP
jgi:hypothetical protein